MRGGCHGNMHGRVQGSSCLGQLPQAEAGNNHPAAYGVPQQPARSIPTQQPLVAVCPGVSPIAQHAILTPHPEPGHTAGLPPGYTPVLAVPLWSLPRARLHRTWLVMELAQL